MKVVAIFFLSVIAVGVQSNPQPMPVKVHLAPNLRRAAGSPHYYLRVKRSDDSDSSSGSLINVPLTKPPNGVFGSNLQYHVIGENEDGNMEHKEDCPSQDELDSIEDSIFVHPPSGSAVSVNGKGDDAKVNGLLYNNGIKHNGTGHNLKMHDWPEKDDVLFDYVDIPRNLTPSPIQSRSTIIANPEIWVFFDYDNSKVFNFDRTAILDYLGVFFHAVNNRFATITEGLKVNFRISGVTTVTSKSAQPFLENSKLSDGSGYDISKTLSEFSYWSFENQNSMKFDLAAVFAGAEHKMKNSDGSWSTSVSGLAYLKAACWKTSNRNLGSSVSEDIGGTYQGVYTVAHEFAHNLGAPHDGNPGSEDCPWSDGYLMSYEGWGNLSKFKFSTCSVNAMKTYITTTQGSCTRSLESSTTIPVSSDAPGDRLSMTKQCQLYVGMEEAYPEPTKTPDELCRNLACRYPDKERPGYSWIRTFNRPAGDNTPCGTAGGRCTFGYCKV